MMKRTPKVKEPMITMTKAEYDQALAFARTDGKSLGHDQLEREHIKQKFAKIKQDIILGMKDAHDNVRLCTIIESNGMQTLHSISVGDLKWIVRNANVPWA